MAAVLTYSPSDVVLDVSGYTMTGVVRLSIEWNAETFKTIRGIRGKNTRVQSLDTGATLTVELLQTSLSNDVLSDLFTLDKSYQSSRLQVYLKDKSGRTEISSSEAFVSNLPSVSFSNELETRVWKILLLETSSSAVKGNSTDLPDILNSSGEFVDKIVDNVSGAASDFVGGLF